MTSYVSIAGVLALGLTLAAPAFAADLITCTPLGNVRWGAGQAVGESFGGDYQPLFIPHIDLETGAYFDVDRYGEVLNAATWIVLSWGEPADPIDFVAVDPVSWAYIRVSIGDEPMPFIHVEHSGALRTGTCVYGDKR